MLWSRGAQGVSGPLLSCVWNLRVFLEMHDGDSAPSCCAFTHWVAFLWIWEGPLGTPLGMAQWNRASFRVDTFHLEVQNSTWHP